MEVEKSSFKMCSLLNKIKKKQKAYRLMPQLSWGIKEKSSTLVNFQKI